MAVLPSNHKMSPSGFGFQGVSVAQTQKLWAVPPQPHSSLFPPHTVPQKQTCRVFLVPPHLFATAPFLSLPLPPLLAICNVEIDFYGDILTYPMGGTQYGVHQHFWFSSLLFSSLLFSSLLFSDSPHLPYPSMLAWPHKSFGQHNMSGSDLS